MIEMDSLISLGTGRGQGGCRRLVGLVGAQLVPDFDEGLRLGVAP